MTRLYYKTLGLCALTLGIIGAFLPLLPTTVFILIAAWCFAKSSPRWHQRLLAHKTFGAIIYQWEQHRCIPTKARIIAISSMLISGGISLWLLESTLLKSLLVALIAWGIYYIHSIKDSRIPVRIKK